VVEALFHCQPGKRKIGRSMSIVRVWTKINWRKRGREERVNESMEASAAEGEM
jgi:hypothetical protein